MATIEELKREIELQRKRNMQIEQRRREMINKKMSIRSSAIEKRNLERELELLRNPKKAEAIAGLKKQGKFIGGMFRKVYDAIPDPHEEKPVRRKPVKKKVTKKKAVRRRTTKRKRRK